MNPENKPIERPGGELIRSELYKTDELNLIQVLKESGLELNELNPLIYEMFTDKNFVRSIPEEIKNNPNRLGAWLKNSTLFSNIRHNDDILGEDITIPETNHADGRVRREESGQKLLMEKIRELGVDPENVLYFRRTQPTSDISNPEHYWTSDYWETVSGLSNEISGTHRDSSVILCSTLNDISSDSILIPDINDDNGLPVRRVSQSLYDQKRSLFIIKNDIKNLEEQENPSLEEILPIQKTFGLKILTKENIKDFVEKPLVKACEIFWDKNIKTLESSANVQNIGNTGYIGLDFNSLSEENKEIARQYGNPNKLYVNDPNTLSLRIPITIDQGESLEEISNKAIQIANRFNKQKATWVSGITLEEHLNQFEENFGTKYPDAVLKEKEMLSNPGAWEEECKRKGEYFDIQTQTSWPSEELYKKANESF